MQTSQNKLSESEIARAWAQFTLKIWLRNLTRQKIGQRSSGDLFRSFQYKVFGSASGDIQRIEFAFHYLLYNAWKRFMA